MKVKYLGKKNSSKILNYSPSLLDSVKRLQRPSSNYYGIDYWNAYEFSYLNKSSQQKLETLEIQIPADSKITVESKSLKIYLASFYKKKFKASINPRQLIAKDLSKLLQSKILVRKKNFYEAAPKALLMNRSVAMVPRNKIIKYEGFRSICPVTSQPDWANIYIHSSSSTLDAKKIVKLLQSFKERGDFHEACIDSIFLSLIHDFHINDLTVCGRFLRRGGIDINPIRSTKKKIFFNNFRDFNQ